MAVWQVVVLVGACSLTSSRLVLLLYFIKLIVKMKLELFPGAGTCHYGAKGGQA
jgi:hypothetical protein